MDGRRTDDGQMTDNTPQQKLTSSKAPGELISIESVLVGFKKQLIVSYAKWICLFLELSAMLVMFLLGFAKFLFIYQIDHKYWDNL